MFGSLAGATANFIPMPAIAAVSASPSARRMGTTDRLCAMSKPPSKVIEYRAHMFWPAGIRVLARDPFLGIGEFIGRRLQRNAVSEVNASITQREEFRLQKICPTE